MAFAQYLFAMAGRLFSSCTKKVILWLRFSRLPCLMYTDPDLVRYMKAEERLKHIPIIMMSSQQNPTLSADAFSAGAQVFLAKPFTPSQLLAMLQMLAGQDKKRKRG
ncbi:MAG: response regulator [Pyrinomonadaceae bacterium]